MKAVLTDLTDNGRKGKPAIKKKIPCLDTVFLGLAQEVKHYFGRLFDAFHSSFVASSTLIKTRVNATQSVTLIFGTEQGKGNWEKSIAIRPAQGKHSKSTDIFVFLKFETFRRFLLLLSQQTQ